MMQPGCNKEIGKANVFLARRFIIQRMKELKNKKGFKSWGSLMTKKLGAKQSSLLGAQSLSIY